MLKVKQFRVDELENKLKRDKKADNVTVKGVVTDVCLKKRMLGDF